MSDEEAYLQCPFCTVKIKGVGEAFIVGHEDTPHPEWMWMLVGELPEAA